VVVVSRREPAGLVCLYEERLAKGAKNRERLRASELEWRDMNFGLC
jgi:hypothetical protein